MVRPNVAGLYELTARGAMPGGEQWANVMHVQGDTFDPEDSTQILALGNAFQALYSSTNGLRVNEWNMSEASLTSYEGANSQGWVVPVTTVVGASNTDPLPNEVALVVSLRTEFIGRSNRGRTYHCGFVEDANGQPSGGAARPDATMIGTFATAYNTFADALVTIGLQLVVFSRTTTVWRSVTDIGISNEWGTMRSRGRQLARSYTNQPL